MIQTKLAAKGRYRHYLPEKQRRRWASRQPRVDTWTGQRTRKSNSEETSTFFKLLASMCTTLRQQACSEMERTTGGCSFLCLLDRCSNFEAIVSNPAATTWLTQKKKCVKIIGPRSSVITKQASYSERVRMTQGARQKLKNHVEISLGSLHFLPFRSDLFVIKSFV